ncbi:MAG: Phosphoribosylaminoimidazole-succinocarboxamide synthase [Ignavibacteria bacterium ADurb.Bin266]|nr:MAG: Phosphoribosylaminoimidazole-succinocarboxamide synthase [Ignavibacteria bacterium ADurb.Bin266]
MKPITKIEIPEVKKIYSGKVRDLYPVDEEHMIIVSTDRISAFDYIFPNGIPGKGAILNTISSLWFKNMKFIKNHIVEDNFSNFPAPYSNYPEFFKDRAVIVKRTKRIDFECVARGYIIGSGWKEYQEKGSVSGVSLPAGLKMAAKLPETIFTPATKADIGHDINVSIDVIKENLGESDTELLKDMTIKIYEYGKQMLEKTGIILADTKFEFGYLNGEIILIDEVMTPDSSRFWDLEKYEVGKSPVSFDKQFIRDYIDTTPWDKNSPPPPLPEEIVTKTAEKYGEILNRIQNLFK